MSNQSKCEMARLRYCQKTYFGYCNADDTDVDKCPYLKAIRAIARLAVENSKLEDKLKWLWSGFEVCGAVGDYMSSDFLEWLKEHKDEYGVKIIENPTEEQKMQFARDFQEVVDFIQSMKKFAH